jgi:hypothetical protein
MSFTQLLIHTVVVYNPTSTTTDPRYGDEVLVMDAGTTVKGRVDVESSTETLNDRDTRVTKAKLFLDPDVVISALSEWTWSGRRFRVNGEPITYYDSASPHHIEAESEEIVS